MVPPDDVRAFLRSWHGVAATLIDRHLTVSGRSPLAEALFPRLSPGVNLVRQVFLGSAPDAAPPCATDMSSQVVAALQASLASHREDEEFRQIVGELSAMSREFSTAWANDDVELQPHGVVRASHPDVGDLVIRYQLLELSAGFNDVLIVWQAADPASQTALDRLVLAG